MSELRRELTFGQLFALAFGTIIGVGWILTMGAWLGYAGGLGSLLTWVVGGAVMILVGLCYAEIAAIYPVTGGEVAYGYAVFGLPWGFAAGWFIALTYIATTAYEAIGAAWLLSTLIPGVEGPELYSVLGQPVRVGSLIVGTLLMLLLAWLNFQRAALAARVQEWMTWGLIVVSIAFVAAGIAFGDVANLRPWFGSTPPYSATPVRGFFAMLAMVPFFYVGFNVVPQALGEKAAGVSAKAVAWAIIGSVVAAGLFYMAVTLAAAMVVPRAVLLASPLPVAAAFQAAFGVGWVADLVIIAGFLGLLTTWNAVYFAAARVLYAFGRAGVIHPWFSRVSGGHGTPANAIVFVGAIGLVGMFAGRGAVVPIANALSSAMTAVFALVCFAVWRLRSTAPELPRPYRAPVGRAGSLMAGLLCLGMTVLALYQAADASEGVPPEWLVLIVWSLLGIVFWFAARASRVSVPDESRRSAMLNPD